uniref:Uncharacterized protein n=1 Tax=Anguilla anguilla TaxID=7936 RepID=A0A0E9P9K3_ANGAN
MLPFSYLQTTNKFAE